MTQVWTKDQAREYFAKGRLPSPGRTYRTEGMNKTEAAYADKLEAERLAGMVVKWEYEALKLRLADKTFYTPDFLVVAADGVLELHEVKGFWEDDARVKIKVAAKQFPYFRFQAVKKGKGNTWSIETF